jgi:protein SCO1/2
MSRSAKRATALLVGVIAAAAIRSAYAQPAGPIPGLSGFGGSFELTDQDGRQRTDADFRGKLLVVTFGYASCPDVCPLDLQKVSIALEQVGADIAAETVPLFISIDPEHDTPERLKRFVRQFGGAIVGLTGSREQVARVAAAYRLHVAAPNHAGEHELEHSSFQYLMGADGKFLTLIRPDATAEEIAVRLRKYAADPRLSKEPI